MIECLDARFECGDQVRVVRNIRNDGSYNDMAKGELLVEQGETGYVRDAGYFLQDQVIYRVFFPHSNRMVGVRDTEVIAAGLDWEPCLFRVSDHAQLRLSLKVKEKIIASKGDRVEIEEVKRHLESGRLEYLITAGGLSVRVPARVLGECDWEN